METYRENIIEHATKVLNDFKGNKERAIKHFERTAVAENNWILEACGENVEDLCRESALCAEYLKSL